MNVGGATVGHGHDRGSIAVHGEEEVRGWSFSWLCEKWSEDAVDFARRRLEREGVTHLQDGYEIEPSPLRDRIASVIAGRDVAQPILVPRMIPIRHGVTSEALRRLVGPPEEAVDFPGNLLLNEGIQRLEDLLIAAGGVAYNNANAFIGVGDTATAEAATQTELLAAAAATNRFYKGMVATYPIRTAQTIDWRSDFTSTEGNFVWAEWTISAGATTASGAGFLVGTTNLNRKVQSLGTKATGTWTMTGSVTIA